MPETFDMQAAHAHAVADYPRESCGLLLASGEYVPCRNIAQTPLEHFILCPRDYAAAEDRGEIAAVVHSHPDLPARASHADRVGCEASGLPWAIIAVGSEGVVDTQWIEPEGWEAPYTGREYCAGALDCYTIVQDWYRREMGVELPDFPADRDCFWQRGENLLVERMDACGMVRVDGPPQRGDVAFMTIGRSSVINHLGIYLGDGTFLHHPYRRLSRIDVFGGQWAEKTSYFVRRYDSGSEQEGSG